MTSVDNSLARAHSKSNVDLNIDKGPLLSLLYVRITWANIGRMNRGDADQAADHSYCLCFFFFFFFFWGGGGSPLLYVLFAL